MGRRFPDIGGAVPCGLGQGHDLDVHDFSNSYGRQNPEGKRPNELVWRRQVFLERVDAQQRQLAYLGVRVCVVRQVHVHQLFQFYILYYDVFHNTGEKMGHVRPCGHLRQKPFHATDSLRDASRRVVRLLVQ